MKVAICLIFKNEHRFLKEFIDYHKSIGVDDFLIYDNNSSSVVSGYESYVKVTDWKDDKIMKQQRAYFHCIFNNKNNYDWIGFIDTDEFIILKKHNNIKDLLREYNEYEGLAINWLCFGDSYLESFKSHKEFFMHTNKTYTPNNHVKSFIKPKAINTFSGNFLHTFPCNTVGENYDKVNGPFRDHSREKVYIKHCFTRCKEDFREKVKRGRGDGVYSERSLQLLTDWESTQRVYNSSQEETKIWK